MQTPHEIWHGSPPEGDLIPLLKPEFCRRKRTNKLEPKAEKCSYLSPAPGSPRDAVRVLTVRGSITITGHLTLARTFPKPSRTLQQAIQTPSGVKDSTVDPGQDVDEAVVKTPAVDTSPSGSSRVPSSPYSSVSEEGGAAPQILVNNGGGEMTSSRPRRGG